MVSLTAKSSRIMKPFLHPRFWPTWLGLGLLRLFALLPLPVLAGIGNCIGELSYHLFKSRRRITQKNLQSCFPDWPVQKTEQVSRQCFRFIGQSIFFSGFGWWASPQKLNQKVNIINREHYDQALTEGRNIILLAPHFCALELAGIVLSQERPMISMYQHTKNRLVDRYVKLGRGRFDGILVERKEPLRNLIRLIRKGYPFYYLPDQDARDKGVFAPFFGIQASTIPVLGKFTAMSKSVVIPCATKILPNGKGFEVYLGRPLDNFPTGDDVVDTTIMNQAIEQMVEPMPEQYFWVHKRFKTRPEGEAAFY